MKFPTFTVTQRMVAAVCAASGLALWASLFIRKPPWAVLAKIGSPDKPSEFVAVFGWWGALVSGLILLVLAALTPWWCRKLDLPAVTPARVPRWFWPGTAAAMVLGAALTLPRLAHGVWDDEDNSVRRVIHGEMRTLKDGSKKWFDATWERAFFLYDKPTNHHLQTIASKASLDLWKSLTGRNEFAEVPARVPVFVAGILAIGALALWVRSHQLPAAGVLAAFLLATHPWHIRYSAELRGYGFVLLLLPLLGLSLHRALATWQWKWWAGFGASQLALLYAYPGTLWVLVAANVGGLIVLANPATARAIPRLLATSALAGVGYILLMAPCIPQLAGYLRTQRALGELTERWHRNLAAHFLSGIPWNNSDQVPSPYPELQSIAAPLGILFPALVGTVGLLAAVGMVVLILQRPYGWLVPFLSFVPAGAVYLGALLGKNYLYEWYLILALPGLLACLAVGTHTLARLAAAKFAPAEPILCGALVVAMLTLNAPAMDRLRSGSLQPRREAVQIARADSNAIVGTFGINFGTYDHDLELVRSVNDITALLDRAESEGRPLAILFGNAAAASQDYPGLIDHIAQSDHFAPPIVLHGFDPSLTVYVYQSKPDPTSR